MYLCDHILFWHRHNALPELTPQEREAFAAEALARCTPHSFAELMSLIDFAKLVARDSGLRVFPHQQRLLESIKSGERVRIVPDYRRGGFVVPHRKQNKE